MFKMFSIIYATQDVYTMFNTPDLLNGQFINDLLNKLPSGSSSNDSYTYL